MMMTEPLMVGGLVFLVTMMGLTALIVGTVAHTKGAARGYAQGHSAGHQKGLEQGRDEGRATGFTAGVAAAATANPQVIRTPHVAAWERTRVSGPQPAATRLQPATVPAVDNPSLKPSPTPRQKRRDGRGGRWSVGVEHTLEWPIGRHAKKSPVAPLVAPTATSTEVLPAVKPKKVL